MLRQTCRARVVCGRGGVGYHDEVRFVEARGTLQCVLAVPLGTCVVRPCCDLGICQYFDLVVGTGVVFMAEDSASDDPCVGYDTL